MVFQFLCLKGVHTHSVTLKSHFACFEISKYIRQTCFVVIVVNINSCNLHVIFFEFVNMFSGV